MGRAAIGVNYDGQLIKNQWYDGYNHDEGIHDLIAFFRKNTQLSHFRETSKATSRIGGKYHFRHLVDIKVYSFDLHMTKPERFFVETMIAKTSVRPGEIVYIDDNDSYAQSPHRIWQCVVIHGRMDTAGRRAALRQYGVEC